jgi:very-short-patch-repair endonuclease
LFGGLAKRVGTMASTLKQMWEDLQQQPIPVRLRVYAMFIKYYSEVALEQLEHDIAQIESYDPLYQSYLWAYWHTYLPTPKPPRVDFPVLGVDQLNAMMTAFREVFGPDWFDSELPPKPSSELKTDVARRLDWLKQCVGKEFEQKVFSIVDRHDIVSPIEQIFLMQWCYAKVEDRFRLKLQPQKPFRTEAGEFFLDYVVTSADNDSPTFAVAIELDGHEFHEKTKEQVIQDKRRERAILQAGIKDRLTVLRFSGSEIVRNCKGCIAEVVKFIEKMRTPR